MSSLDKPVITVSRTQNGIPIDEIIATVTFNATQGVQTIGISVFYDQQGLYPGVDRPQYLYQLPPGQTSPFVASLRNIIPTPGLLIHFGAKITNESTASNSDFFDFTQPTSSLPVETPSNFTVTVPKDGTDLMNMSWNVPLDITYDSLYVSDNNAMAVNLTGNGGKVEASYNASSNGIPASNIITYVLNAVKSGNPIVALPQYAYSYYGVPPPPAFVSVTQLDPTNNPTQFQVFWTVPLELYKTTSPPTGTYFIDVKDNYSYYETFYDTVGSYKFQFYINDYKPGVVIQVGVAIQTATGLSAELIGSTTAQ
jgi:hypothetical protein